VPLNVLFVVHHHGLYGSSRSLMNLLDGVREYGVKPFVVVPKEGGFTEALDVRGIQYKVVPVVYWMIDKTLSVGRKMRVAKELYQSSRIIQQLIRKWDIELVYSNSSVSPVGRLAALWARIPHIWHIREFGDLDFSLKFIFPKALSYTFIKSSDAVICHANVVRAHHFKHNPERVHLVYNGSATGNQFDTLRKRKTETQKLDENYDFAILSSITPKKGQETAIRAISELRKRGLRTRLIIAGTGKPDYVNHCEQLAGTLGVSHLVEFRGFVDDPYEVYFASDCILVCSDNEALSRTALEAMSVCLPIIGRNSGGTPEIIEDKKTGLLYNTFDELVDAMNAIVVNAEWGRRLGMEGWAVARQRFTIEEYAANVYQIIQSVARI
jgi:glycosyltransferase involved in cell wall biosynthesis